MWDAEQQGEYTSLFVKVQKPQVNKEPPRAGLLGARGVGAVKLSN